MHINRLQSFQVHRIRTKFEWIICKFLIIQMAPHDGCVSNCFSANTGTCRRDARSVVISGRMTSRPASPSPGANRADQSSMPSFLIEDPQP
jgi:hypothetical protein